MKSKASIRTLRKIMVLSGLVTNMVAGAASAVEPSILVPGSTTNFQVQVRAPNGYLQCLVRGTKVKLPGKAETYLYVIFEPGTKVWWRMHVNLTPQEIGGFATNELWAVPGLGLARIEARDRLFAEISTAKADSLAVAAGATFTEFEETIRSHSPMAGFAEYGAVLDEAVGEDFFREPKSTYIAPNVRVTSVEYRNNKWRIEISSVRMQSSAALEFDASFRMLRAWRDGALVYPK